jgi:hypothetical protein
VEVRDDARDLAMVEACVDARRRRRDDESATQTFGRDDARDRAMTARIKAEGMQLPIGA